MTAGSDRGLALMYRFARVGEAHGVNTLRRAPEFYHSIRTQINHRPRDKAAAVWKALERTFIEWLEEFGKKGGK